MNIILNIIIFNIILVMIIIIAMSFFINGIDETNSLLNN